MTVSTPTELWNKDFIKYIIGLEFHLIAVSMLQFALPLYFLIQTGNPTLMGTVLTLVAISDVVFCPLGGIVGDRLSKRQLIGWSNTLIALITAAYAIFGGQFNFVTAFIVFMLLLYSFLAFLNPAFESTVPLLVSEESLIKANSINFMLSILSGVGSPLVAGFIMERYGIVPILWTSVVLFGIAALFKFSIDIPFEAHETSGNIMLTIFSDMVSGLKFVMKKSKLHGRIFKCSTLYMLVFWPLINLIMPVLVNDYFGLGESVNGIVRAIILLGASLGVILVGKFSERATIYAFRKMIFYSSLALIPVTISFAVLGNHLISLIILIAALFIIWTILTMHILILWTFK